MNMIIMVVFYWMALDVMEQNQHSSTVHTMELESMTATTDVMPLPDAKVKQNNSVPVL